MYGPIFFGPAKPPRVGTDWRKRGETLSWRVVSVDDTTVKLSGPGPCRGTLYVDLKDFVRSYERV